jgi:hypothetical protein
MDSRPFYKRDNKYKGDDKTIRLTVNLYHHYPGRDYAAKYSIPFNKRSKFVKENEMASGIYDNSESSATEGVSFIMDNYKDLKLLFSPENDDMEVKEAMAGFLKHFFKKSPLTEREPVGKSPMTERQPGGNRKYVPRKDISAAGFDGAGYSKHKGMWKDRPMGDFKKLFDD